MGKMLHSPLRPGGVHSATRKRGAKRSPSHKIFAAKWHETRPGDLPEVCVIPSHMSALGNATYGCCVTSEEGAAKEAYSVQCGLPELVVQDQEVINAAQAHGDLNGADLTEVLDWMMTDGMTINGTNYKNGPHEVVDYTDDANIGSAAQQGPIKIAIDANALSPDAGNGNGWYNVGGNPGEYQNTDHCVSLFGRCKASTFFGKLGMTVPAGIDPNSWGYPIYTWGGVGWCDHAWIMATCTEAHLRTPTTTGQGPNPQPQPLPVPSPAQLITSTGTASDPGQSFTVPGLFGAAHTVVLPSRSLAVSVTGALPSSGLTTDTIAGYLAAAGITADSAKLTPAQWQAILALLFQLLPIFFPPSPSGTVGDRIGKLSPQQWQAILALIMQLLPIIIGG